MANPVDDSYGGLLWPDASGVGDATASAAAAGALEEWAKGGAEDASSGVDLGQLTEVIKVVAKGGTDVAKTVDDIVRNSGGGSPGQPMTPVQLPPKAQPPVPVVPAAPPAPVIAPAKPFPTAAVVGGAVLVVTLVTVVAVAASSGRRKRRSEVL